MNNLYKCYKKSILDHEHSKLIVSTVSEVIFMTVTIAFTVSIRMISSDVDIVM